MTQFELPPSPSARPGRHSVIWLVAAAGLTVLLWRFPWGNYLLYPFTLLATWFHEMGHGLMALLLGGEFHRLEVYPDGSGLAIHSGELFLGRVGRALVAAAGPMGPPIAGALFILTSRRRSTARLGLVFLGSLLLLSTLLWVRSPFGLLFLPAMGLGILAVARWAAPWLRSFALQFLGVQACVSTYHQLDYLFMDAAVIDGRLILSDSSQIAQNLFLPYWFWGGVMAVFSLVLLITSLQLAFRD
ncbi:M50 family metallopeptidase [Synechococcus sp. H60.2]|uniref:M50 family metallopeptidase n=1 Tax=Synechococcus sp. H60.2 TaxID=2964518 RepID=UPI0039C18C87